MKTIYGISFSDRDISLLPNVPAVQILELSGELATAPGFALPEHLQKKSIIICNSDERKFFNTIPDASSGVRQDFYRLCEHRCAAAENLQAVYATFAPELESAFAVPANPVLRDAFAMCFGFAEKHRTPLALEVRIPGIAAGATEKFAHFKHSLLYPLRTMCVLHPHEPGALEIMEKFAAELPFDCDMFRIVFDAAAGNYLSGTLLQRILKFIRPAGAVQPVMIFAPGKNADPSVYLELNKLILTELHK